jgi:succinate dehydrogenase/fumarate reductase flavoprotein subunit
MPNKMAWEYDNELLITLCKHCHSAIHEMNKIFILIAKNYIINKIDLLSL